MAVRYEKGNFAIVPNLAEIMAVGTSEAGLKVYIALCKFSDEGGGSFPAIETIRDFACLSESGVKKGLREIKDNGFVEVTKRVRPNGSHASNHYQILIVCPSQVGVTDVTQGGSRTEPPLTIPIEHPTKVGADAQSPKEKDDEIKKNFYLVVKKYSLPVLNHKHIDSWCDKLRAAHGEVVALAYLQRLQQRDLREESRVEKFVPTLSKPMDILEKSVKIIAYFTRTKGSTAGDAYGYKNGQKIFTEDEKGNKYWGGELITPENQDQVLKERMAD